MRQVNCLQVASSFAHSHDEGSDQLCLYAVAVLCNLVATTNAKVAEILMEKASVVENMVALMKHHFVLVAICATHILIGVSLFWS